MTNRMLFNSKITISFGVSSKLKKSTRIITQSCLTLPTHSSISQLERSLDFFEFLPIDFRLHTSFYKGMKCSWLPIRIEVEDGIVSALYKDSGRFDFNVETGREIKTSIAINKILLKKGVEFSVKEYGIVKYKVAKCRFKGIEVSKRAKIKGAYFLQVGLVKVKVVQLSLTYIETKDEWEVECSTGDSTKLVKLGLGIIPFKMQSDLESEELILVKIKLSRLDDFDKFFIKIPSDGGGHDDDSDFFSELEGQLTGDLKINTKLNNEITLTTEFIEMKNLGISDHGSIRHQKHQKVRNEPKSNEDSTLFEGVLDVLRSIFRKDREDIY